MNSIHRTTFAIFVLLAIAATATSSEAGAPVECTASHRPFAVATDAAPLAVPHAGLPGTNFERTFIAIKPDGVQRGLIGEILGRFERKGLQVVGLKMMQAPTATVESHYAEHRERPFFGELVSFFTSGPVVIVALQGRKAIASARTQIGKTRPEESAAGTIRGDLAVDTPRNVIHGSDSAEAAARELSLWFAAGELVDWQPALAPWLYEKL